MKRLLAVAVLLAGGVLFASLRATVTPAPGDAPEFSLPRLDPSLGTLASADLRGRVTVLNVWATWCVPCRQEHATLLAIARADPVPIYGLNYRDRRDDARRWLAHLGDPYVATGFDHDGRVAADFGARGVPETYVVDRFGRIAHRHLGPLTMDAWRQTLSPLIDRLRAG